jgi:glyoxylase-like metal-dependent hydrolase (beta-lactamase superfamily II)
MADFRVISIGAMASNPMWGERTAVRTGHATTTLIVSGSARIVIDPGLPGAALAAKLAERSNLTPRDITHVFLTCFSIDCRRGLGIFDSAEWLISEVERESLGVPLALKLREELQREDPDQELVAMLKSDVELLSRFKAAPDALADGVDLFPLPGVTPGMCGILMPDLQHSTLICGDAIPTIEYLERGAIMPGAIDVNRAQESFREAVEIADLLVLGRDNLVANPTKRLF